MSANSPCKVSKNVVGKIVLPGTVVDRSLIDSVTGFIQDVVPHVRFCLDTIILFLFREYSIFLLGIVYVQ